MKLFVSTRVLVCALLALLVVAGAVWTVSVAARDVRTNLILITIDTVRDDRLGCYGYDLPTSPNINALADSCLLFRNAFTPIPFTGPCHATLLTGLNPASHGVVDNATSLADSLVTLAEILSARGYETGVSCPPVSFWGRVRASHRGLTDTKKTPLHRNQRET